MQRMIVCVVLTGLLTGCVSLPCRPVALPWHTPEASQRQVVCVRTAEPRTDSLVDIALALPESGLLRVVDPNAPDYPLPIFRDGTHIRLQLPGELTAERLLAVYWAEGKLPEPSPLLDRPPLAGDDYATAAHGDAWDFDEGDQDGIRSWGDRPNHYGTITVHDGMLTVPVTGPDPYCIWGVMFGNPADQPPGHAGTPAEHIDSSLYSRLRMRIRQSCDSADWTFFFTDEKGRYQNYGFTVRGKDFQTLEFDLRKIFPGFWDGRIMRAFRLDTTNGRPGTTVDLDWVRIERTEPEVDAGPVFSREAVLQRKYVTGFRTEVPKTVIAGGEAEIAIRDVRGSAGMSSDAAVFACELRTPDGYPFSVSYGSAGGNNGAGRIAASVGPRVRELVWALGPADDMGRPAAPVRTGKIAVIPAPLDHYRLVPDSRFVAVEGARRTSITVIAEDAFGNPVPMTTEQESVSADNGAEVTVMHKRNGTCRLGLQCSKFPLTTHTVTFTDSSGKSGSCEVRTLTHRESTIAITATGYLTIDGDLFLPLGGFYANWPSALPDADGVINRSIDLFPCGPTPYPHGYPWPEDIETKVVDYLDLCSRNGVTALRLMLRNMDIVGRVDPVQLQAVLHLFDLARPRGIRFNVALFEDYNKPPYCNETIIEKIVLPHYSVAELAALPEHRARFLVRRELVGSPAARYLDADAIRCQEDYLDELIPVLAGREEVLCYEFENEMVNPPMSWCREIVAYIRGIDPRTPILGNPGPHAWPEPWRWRDSTCDLFSYHPYNDGMPEADHGAIIYARSKWAAAAGIPFYTGEGGINQNRWQSGVAKVPDACAMRGIRDQIWLSILCGANGALMWTACFESEMAEFAKVKPALTAMNIDLLSLERRQPNVVVTMPDDASANHSAYILAGRLLACGIDVDVRPAGESDGYRVQLDGHSSDIPADLQAEFFAPGEGWQAATLVAKNADQALVYLRNTAGGIGDYGDEKRPCWLRTPQPAIPFLKITGGTWTQVRAFDLDAGTPIPVERSGDRVTLPAATAHDLVFGFRK